MMKKNRLRYLCVGLALIILLNCCADSQAERSNNNDEEEDTAVDSSDDGSGYASSEDPSDLNESTTESMRRPALSTEAPSGENAAAAAETDYNANDDSQSGGANSNNGDYADKEGGDTDTDTDDNDDAAVDQQPQPDSNVSNDPVRQELVTDNPKMETNEQQQKTYESNPFKLLNIVSKPGIMAGIVGGAVIGVLTAILLIMFIVYRMRKKDEGSYALEETKKPLSAYDYRHCPTKEFYA